MADDLGTSGDITRWLEAASEGDPTAMDEVFAAVYPRLRALARSKRRGWSGDETVDTTALVHEAYLKVAAQKNPKYKDRAHFFAMAARAMRQVLVNHAEKRQAAKRGGRERDVTLEDDSAAAESGLDDLLMLDGALRQLEEMSPRQARVVECLFFAGLTIEETAEALESSAATVKRDWSTARVWLFRALQGARDGDVDG